MSTTRGRICVSIAAEDAAAALRLATPVLPIVDLVEIRLDAMRIPDFAPCLAAIPKPVLMTNRPQWEGGQFGGSEEARIDTLCRAVEAGAAYVDIELRTEASLRDRLLAVARRHEAKVVVSSHDFAATPALPVLRETLGRMIASGADIGKIVTTAATAEEALRILSLQLDARAVGLFPLSAFAMGEVGRISRVATLYLGGCMTYVAPDELQATAPGQLSASRLDTLISLFEARA